YSQTVSWSTTLNWLSDTYKPYPNNELNRYLRFSRHTLVFTHARKRAFREAQPGFAQYLRLSYAHPLDGNRFSQLYMHTQWALPDLIKSHYWTLRGEYLQHSAKQAEIQLASSYLGVRGTPFYTG